MDLCPALSQKCAKGRDGGGENMVKLATNLKLGEESITLLMSYFYVYLNIFTMSVFKI